MITYNSNVKQQYHQFRDETDILIDIGGVTDIRKAVNTLPVLKESIRGQHNKHHSLWIIDMKRSNSILYYLFTVIAITILTNFFNEFPIIIILRVKNIGMELIQTSMTILEHYLIKFPKKGLK